ncbi:unnamed protein product [Phytophthora fragariaefolia]|uniref:Unnamed protein product n=1 Tax=Phytophthora fragariaefolia TaxID=1490495 RepID=A0A9W7CZP2_9STRA|nr:unnamed protein product [Phytophthora fragariaefolia]
MPKPNLADRERYTIIDELLKLSNNGVLPRGAFTKVCAQVAHDPTTVSLIWKRYSLAVAAGVTRGYWANRINQNSGRKRKNRDGVQQKLTSVSVENRTVERRIAAVSNLSRHLIRQSVKEGIVTHRTAFIKPALTVDNKIRRTKHALSFIDDTTLDFEPMHNIVHVDEKRFYADHDRRSYLVFDGEELPLRA